jgi:DNA ligase-associated metallophosphoesterase
MTGTSALPVAAAGETLLCLAEHALLWPAEHTLFVADVHLGKAASFRAAGVPLPSGHSEYDLDRLAALIAAHGVCRLVILGDLVHTQTSYTSALDRKFRDFRTRHEIVDMLLVRGNHDVHAGDAPPEWGLRIVAEPFALGPFACCHEPDAARGGGYELAGHLHPAVRLETAREGLTLPCFWQHARGIVLPAFGSLTGKYAVRLKSAESAVVVAGTQLHHIRYRG